MSALGFLGLRPDYPDDDVHAQAAYWRAMLDSDRCQPAQQRSFELWLEATPDNRAAFSALDDTLSSLEQLADDADLLALRSEALGQGINPRRMIRLGVGAGIAAAALAGLFAAGMLSFHSTETQIAETASTNKVEQLAALPNDRRLHLETSIGEQLTRTLADGSTLELNTDSAVRVELSDAGRDIYMLRGQAMFDVAHDKTRPFVVYAGDRRVTALGTLFEVRLEESSTRVTLLEGKVRVAEIELSDLDHQDDPNDPTVQDSAVSVVELAPGERYVSAEGSMSSVTAEMMEADLSWRQGRHIFVDAKLSHIVSELNRYTMRKIVLEDPGIGELVASANFKLGSTRSLAIALEENFGLSITDETTRDHILVSW